MRPHQILGPLALLAGVLLAGCRSEEPGSDEEDAEISAPHVEQSPVVVSHPYPGDPNAGREVYMEFCAKCHQSDGSGLNGTLAADLVSEKSRLAKSNEVLLNSLRNGVTRDDKYMPAMKEILSEQEMKDALSYVRSAFGD